MVNRYIWGSGLAASGVLLAAAHVFAQEAASEAAAPEAPDSAVEAEAETDADAAPSSEGQQSARRSTGGQDRSLEESIELQRELLRRETQRDGLVTPRGLRAGEREDVGGTVHSARISSRLEANDNYNLNSPSLGDAVLWTTTFSLSQVSRTTVDNFQISASGDARVADLPQIGLDTALDNALVGLLYGRAVDDNAAEIRFTFNDADVEYFDPLRNLAPNGEFDDVSGSGRRRSSAGSLSLSLAEDGPLSMEFALRGSVVDFYDTTDPSLNDRNTFSGDLELRFDISPTVRGLVGGIYRFDDEESLSDRTSWDVYTGLIADLTPSNRLELRVGYGESEALRRDLVDRLESGTVGSLNYIMDRPNGTLSFNLNSRVLETGRRTEASVSRDRQLATGVISATLGLSAHRDLEVRPFLNFLWSVENPTSLFNIGLRQNFSVNRSGDDVLFATLSANYRYLINPVSSLSFSAVAGREEYLDTETDRNDNTRLTLVAEYSHVVARNWQLSAGYSHRNRVRDEDDDARQNAVFINLNRDFFGRK